MNGSLIEINKKLILMVGILFLLVLAGCYGDNGDNPITDKDVRRGVDGLKMELTKNAPPEKVFEESKFPIVVELKNKGASDIENGILAFGFEKDYADVVKENDAKQEFDIEGKSIFNLNGDEEFIAIDAQTKKIGAQSETHTSTILVTACYPYKTIFGDSVCVDTDIYGMGRGEKACTVKDLSFSVGQGAPVTITKIETRMLPDADENRVKPHFIIYVENKGNGEVISVDKVEEACTSQALEHTDFNVININAVLSGKNLDCSVGDDPGAAIVRLRNKEDMIRCTLEEGIDKNLGAYTAPLSIELEYGYTFTISKDVIIEKILKY